MPKFPPLKNRQKIVKHTQKMCALAWNDKREVFMLSTAHSSKMKKEKNNKLSKPEIIFEYNKNKGGVDRLDMQILFSESTKKYELVQKAFHSLIGRINLQCIYTLSE